MAFNEYQKVNIRRFCGYYLFGSVPVQTFAWRYTTEYGTLEFTMNNMQPQEQVIVETVYLPNLLEMERAIPLVAQNLDTLQAAVWHWNPNELRDRQNLFFFWCKQLAGFMGLDGGPNLPGGGAAFAV